MTFVLRTALDLDAVNLHLGALEAAGLLGISEEDGHASLWFPARVDGLAVDGLWEAVPDRDWNAAWKAGIEPVIVGRVVIVPPWLPPPVGGVVLVIEPAMAFGTGHHETTAACLAALQEVDLHGRRVCDVGTGSGVLALAAAALGAAHVVAVDVDPEAVAAAQGNVVRHGAAIEVRLGSVAAAAPDGPFDVVVANLDVVTLNALAGPLVALVAPNGVLIASGVGNERAEAARDTLAAAGVATQMRRGREWALLVGTRP